MRFERRCSVSDQPSPARTMVGDSRETTNRGDFTASPQMPRQVRHRRACVPSFSSKTYEPVLATGTRSVAFPAATRSENVAAILPARSPCTRATPAALVRKRSVTWKSPPCRVTTGRPSEARTAFVEVAPEKRALTERTTSSVTVHVAVFADAQAPPQPRNRAPRAGVARIVAFAFARRCCTQVFVAPVLEHAPPEVDTEPRPLTPSVSVPGFPVANAADTAVVLDPTVTVHVDDVPEHAPPQPANDVPDSGHAVSVTIAFACCGALQVPPWLPHVIPPPLTVPGPVAETVSVAALAKDAVTLFDAFIETVQVVAVPPHAPVQPRNAPPAGGVATSVTLALAANGAEHTFAPLPQLIAPLPPLTFPVPLTVTLSVTEGAKVAVTLRSADIVSVHEPVPVQSPVQPVKA